VIRWRLPVLAAWGAAIVTALCVYLANFQIDNSVSIWFLEDDPELETYRHQSAKFDGKEWTYIWLRGESVFAPEFLRDLRLLGDEIKSFESVSRVVSLTDAGGIGKGEFGLPEYVELYALQAGDLPNENQAREHREKVRGSPLYIGRLVPRNDDHFTILALQNANRIDAKNPYRIQLMDQLRTAVSSYPAIQNFGIAGTAVINSELNRAAKRDMLIYYGLIAAFVLVGGWLATGSLRDLIVLSAVVTGTVAPTLGILGALDLPFNLMTVMLPTLLVTVSVSYLIHFISEFHTIRESEKRIETASAIASTFRQLLRPGLWTTVTTAIGFASLTVSPVAPIRHVGFFAATGIGIAWFSTVTIAPALLSLLWPNGRLKDRRAAVNAGGNRILEWLSQPRPLLAAALSVTMLVGAGGLLQLEADTNYVNFFRPGSDVRQDYEQLEKIDMPSSYLTVTVQFPEQTLFADQSRHEAMRSFEQSLLSLPGVMDVQSIDGLVEQLASEAGIEKASALYKALLGMGRTNQLGGADEFLTDNGKLVQLRAMTAAMSTRDINTFRVDFDELVKAQPEEWKIALTGTNVLWANMDAHVVRTQLLSIGIMAVVLVALLPLVFRSLTLGLLGFLVSFVPVLCTLGLMGWIGLPVNIATCILGGVVMGLAVDDTIYFLARVSQGRNLGLSIGEAAGQATRTTGRAMIKTSLILTGGFLTMTVSDFMPSVYFGMFFAFSILVALLADLIILPVLLRVVKW